MRLQNRSARVPRRRVPRAARAVALVGLLALGSACVSPPRESEPPQAPPAERAAARRNLGIDHIVNGRIAWGLRELQHAESLYAEDALTQLWLGQAFRLRGRPDEALAHARRAVEIDPTHQEARLNLSTILTDHQLYAEAIEHAQVLVDDPTFATPWRALTNRGWAQLKLGYLADARASFDEALEYAPKYWPALLDLGILSSIERDYVGAIRHLADVVALEPGPGAEAEANYRMAEAYVSIGRRDRAIQHLTLAIDREPNGRWGRQSRAYLQRLQ